MARVLQLSFMGNSLPGEIVAVDVVRQLRVGAMGLMLIACQAAIAQSYDASSYEPSSRLRSRAVACMKDEVEQGAYCIKPCDENFKLEIKGNKALCRPAKAGATRTPPKLEFQTPMPDPKLRSKQTGA